MIYNDCNVEFFKNISILLQNSENIAAKRIYHLLEVIDFNSINAILDVGSWHLKQALEMSFIFPKAHISAFEPNPESAIYCRNVIESLPDNMKQKIDLHEVALNNIKGVVKFYPLDRTKTHSTNEGIASLSKLRSHMDGTLLNDKWIQKEIEVQSNTLDNWCSENNKLPDFIWMDVQGAELNVLKGSVNSLKNVKAICTEAGLVAYYEKHSLKTELDDFLKDLDFIELESAFSKTSWSTDAAAEADVIYVNKRFIL